MSTDELKAARIEHDAINGLPIGSLSSAQKERLTHLRLMLAVLRMSRGHILVQPNMMLLGSRSMERKTDEHPTAPTS